jgi:hypothetical protein
MTAFRRVQEVIAAAGIPEAPHACPKGLRHGFGVQAVSRASRSTWCRNGWAMPSSPRPRSTRRPWVRKSRASPREYGGADRSGQKGSLLSTEARGAYIPGKPSSNRQISPAKVVVVLAACAHQSCMLDIPQGLAFISRGATDMDAGSRILQLTAHADGQPCPLQSNSRCSPCGRDPGGLGFHLGLCETAIHAPTGNSTERRRSAASCRQALHSEKDILRRLPNLHVVTAWCSSNKKRPTYVCALAILDTGSNWKLVTTTTARKAHATRSTKGTVYFRPRIFVWSNRCSCDKSRLIRPNFWRAMESNQMEE